MVMQQGERLQLDPRQVKAQVQELWEASDSGRSFIAALNDRGFAIAKGDRRDFIIIDPAGGVHSLGRCVAARAAEVRSRMADVDRAALPGIEQAIAAMRNRAKGSSAERGAVREEFGPVAADAGKRKPEPDAIQPPSLPPPSVRVLDNTVTDIRVAYSLNNDARGFSKMLEQQGIHLAAVSPQEARQNQAYRAGEIVAVNPTGKVYALDRHTTGEDRATVEKFLGPLDRKQLQGIEATQEQINLRAEQFIARGQVGALDRTSQEKTAPTSLPAGDEGGGKKAIDWRRYITDQNYRREIQGQQEKEHPQRERERSRGGLER